MVRIRLRRTGAKKRASYRIVIADKEAPRDGAFIETVGLYNPRTQPELIQLKEDRVYYWLGVGAQPSEAVQQIFRKTGTLERFERFVKGESAEALLAEAETRLQALQPASLRTRIGMKPKPKPKKAEPAEA